MAAFGILAALRERDRSGEGQLVDVSMADGALSWLAMVAGALLRRRRRAAAAASCELAGSLVCYRPYECADGWVTLGALEPKFWQALVPRRRARGPDRAAVRAPGLRRARARSQRDLQRRARASEWEAFAAEHDCCLEPVLELDEALDSELVRAREMVVELDQPGRRAPVRQLGVPVKLARTPGDATARPARRSASTPTRCCARPATREEEIAALLRVRRRRRARPPAAAGASVPGMSAASTARTSGLLKMSELAERSGVSAGTIKHYLREGLLAGAGHDQPQHGLLPARVRRADHADQAPAGGALHAAAVIKARARRGPRARRAR